MPEIMIFHRYDYILKRGLGGSFKDFLFSPLFDKMIQFDLRIFFRWVGSTTSQFQLRRIHTLPETKIAPESLGLEDEFRFGMAYFQVLC